MPNLAPPITTVEAARAYRDRIIAAAGPGFTPLMTCYLTDDADPDEIARGFEEGVWIAAKLYPAGATTNSASGVTDIRNIYPVLERMEQIGMVLCVHGEVTDPEVDVFDREAVFIERVLSAVVRDFPALKIVFEHITTADAADFVDELGRQHRRDGHAAASDHQPQRDLRRRACGRTLIACRSPSARSTGWRCARPRPPARAKFFLGTDSAPHAREAKEIGMRLRRHLQRAVRARKLCDGVRGRGRARPVRGFASENGPRFYGLPLNEGTVTLERREVEFRRRSAAWSRSTRARRWAGSSPARRGRGRWCRSPHRNDLRAAGNIRMSDV